MKYIADHGNYIQLSTPEEVISFRENRGSGTSFDLSKIPPPSISEKLTRIHKVHGYEHENGSLILLNRVETELLFHYNFKHGHRHLFGTSSFPEGYQESESKRQEAIGYAKMILEAFGWILTFDESEKWYIFNFSPLLALTPEEVSAEIERRINILSTKALGVVNDGLLKHQSNFSRREIGLTPAEVSDIDRDLVIERLRVLLSEKRWLLKNWDTFTFDVIPRTSQ